MLPELKKLRFAVGGGVGVVVDQGLIGREVGYLLSFALSE